MSSSVEEDIKALENPGRWEVRALPDGNRRLILWTQGDQAASWITMSEEDCRTLAAALVKGLCTQEKKPNVPGARKWYHCAECGKGGASGPVPAPPALPIFPLPIGWTLRTTPLDVDDDLLCEACSQPKDGPKFSSEPGVRCSFYDFLKPPRGR